ncbi:hypothetical protein [Phenylobacterium sp.]|uniref:hypothetical protein n=1 Tax=Phenylobacterium sp. TaxID=1871053 RepID=UPI003BA91F5E
MDRRRRRTGALAGLALAAAGFLAAATAAEVAQPLQALHWVTPDADPVATFASQPTECLHTPADPAAAQAVEVGRAAFRTPLLLGGQAARVSLTCESCHRSGRGNPEFQFPGASGAPGTADVTLSLFSSHRGNGVHDPRPIPDLSGPRDRLKVAPDQLPAFIRGLIVEEFDGREPPPAVLAGLAAYVRALSPGACPAEARAPLRPATLLADARRALTAADRAYAAGDRPTAILMVAAARARLGLIDERYKALPAEVARLRAADTRLTALQQAMREGRADASTDLAHWLRDSRRLEAALAAREAASLFNPTRLKAAANRRLLLKPT